MAFMRFCSTVLIGVSDMYSRNAVKAILVEKDGYLLELSGRLGRFEKSNLFGRRAVCWSDETIGVT